MNRQVAQDDLTPNPFPGPLRGRFAWEGEQPRPVCGEFFPS